MSHATKKANALRSLKTSIPQLFQESQKPGAEQRTHAVALRKIQEACALKSPIVENQPHDIDLDGELLFNLEVVRNLNKLLPVKKKEPAVDRVIRFIAAFMQYTQGIDAKETEDMQEEDDEVIDTISSRFVEFLLTHLLRGITVKDKAVRLRCCQIIALSINSLGEIDEDLYQKLKRCLFERVRDKEAPVRIQAVTALSRLQNADDEEDEVDGRTVSEKLIDILQYDPSAEVRRVVLFNLDQTKRSIPYIIERARDVDPINRRFVFLKPMAEIQDFRMLSISQRHQLLDWGLKDRDALVLKAVSKMISTHWIRHADHNLLEFLERLEVVDSPSADAVLEAFLDARPDIIESIEFNDQFWDNLSIESAFLARVFTKFLQKKQYLEKLDKVLPEVTRHAFYIQKYNNAWQQASRETEGNYEYIVGQLLEMAKILDYADEIGRRKMFMLLREIIMVPDIPDDHLSSIVELIKTISLGEQDFTRIMIEIISDIREQVEPEDGAFASEASQIPATPSKRMRLNSDAESPRPNPNNSGASEEDIDPDVIQKMLIQIKCLNICRNMLERSEESLQDNSSMYGLLNELIIPSVQSKEVVLREEGLHCLGLCCCLDKTLGLHNVPLFIHCIRNGHEELQQKALMILFDVIMCYGYTTVAPRAGGDDELKALFQHGLDHVNPEIQAVSVQGICKIMLCRMFKDAEILKLMILLYFYPSTVENQKLRQCLSYFLPVYCYSSSEAQPLLATVIVPALVHLIATYGDLRADEEMVAPYHIAQVMIDWTDPRKISVVLNNPDKPVDMGVQADLAINILKEVFVEHGQTRKILCQLLPKLYIDEAGEGRLRKLTLLCGNLESKKPIHDAITRNAFNRFKKGLLQHFNEPAESLDDEELAKLHNYEEIFEFIHATHEEHIEPSMPTPPAEARAARKRSTKEKARQNIEEIAENEESEESSEEASEDVDDSKEDDDVQEDSEEEDGETDVSDNEEEEGNKGENGKGKTSQEDAELPESSQQSSTSKRATSKAKTKVKRKQDSGSDSSFSEEPDSSSDSD
ncbi:chromosome condensation complex Condensin [Umbelopsis nana]